MGDLNFDPLLHTLGLDADHREPWRNHYVTGANDPTILPLVAAGLVKEIPRPGFLPIDDHVYAATDEGRRLAMIENQRRNPPPSKRRARYLHWLNMSDAYDISFGDYLRKRLYNEGSGPG